MRCHYNQQAGLPDRLALRLLTDCTSMLHWSTLRPLLNSIEISCCVGMVYELLGLGLRVPNNILLMLTPSSHLYVCCCCCR